MITVFIRRCAATGVAFAAAAIWLASGSGTPVPSARAIQLASVDAPLPLGATEPACSGFVCLFGVGRDLHCETGLADAA